MRKSVRTARIIQLVGAIFLVVGIVACTQRSDQSMMSWAFILGGVAVVGARVFEWLSKE